MGLQYGENFMITFLYESPVSPCDGRTDRRTDGRAIA